MKNKQYNCITTTKRSLREFSKLRWGLEHDDWLEDLLKSLTKIKFDDDPIKFSYIAKECGVVEAYWCLQSLPENRYPIIQNLISELEKNAVDILRKKLQMSYEYLNETDMYYSKFKQLKDDLANGDISIGDFNSGIKGLITWFNNGFDNHKKVSSENLPFLALSLVGYYSIWDKNSDVLLLNLLTKYFG